ncbi:GNAT family N-acetyltransferase [Cryobacterium sp.]|jgi:ribosomal protein S18 acetylase RimI-like enzyme|uniref:GNAT family N-acetyltransferase n=1 Tax=Cryobacterium sp. TaxID=1926290 RepID=UPI002626305B|nr:GNAT family N-acetyltransferase [Cryobacterium sp.]MCU1445951.1 acetyltransferase [Cryobacterium sp.]
MTDSPPAGPVTEVRVRPARPGEAAALAELAAATFALACPPHTSADAIAAFLRDVLAPANFEVFLADPERLLLVAENDAVTLMGYTMLVFGEPHDADAADAIRIRPTAELSKCYVRAEAHGTGAAGALMAATLDAARERGATGSWLGVNQENDRALRFYGKHGYERVGIKRFLVGERYEDDYVLERAL